MKIEISEKKFPTNKDVKLSYIPENSETYVYKLYKDGKVIEKYSNARLMYALIIAIAWSIVIII